MSISPEARSFLRRVLETPSPSGYEQPVQQIVREYAGGFADTVRTDVFGNVVAARNPGAKTRVMLAGHCDQIGLIVQYIDAEGFLYVQPIGGWDTQVLVGQRLTVWTRTEAVPGIMARKPIHLLSEEERKQVPKMKDLWLDIGACDKADAEALVRVGDPVTLELGFRELRNGTACSPGMDNKTGLWVVMEALRRIERSRLKVGVFAVSTVQEEVGLRGARTSAFDIDPHAGIAVDVTHATDCPTIEKKQDGDVRLGGGPVVFRGPNMNHHVTQRLVESARDAQLTIQLGALGRAASNDANPMQLNRAGMAVGLVSIPNRYMHSPVEMVSLDDLDRAADLLAAFCEGLEAEPDFTP